MICRAIGVFNSRCNAVRDEVSAAKAGSDRPAGGVAQLLKHIPVAFKRVSGAGTTEHDFETPARLRRAEFRQFDLCLRDGNRSHWRMSSSLPSRRAKNEDASN